MKTLFKPVLAAGLVLAAVGPIAAPAQAQVAGIASSNPEAVFVRSAARITAYDQINTTYAAQITQVTALRKEIAGLQESLDTNKDGGLTQAEVDANPGVVAQMEAKQKEVDTLTAPIALAQYYVIEQLLNDYGNAQTQVVQNKNIKMMFSPDVFQYSADEVDVTDAILEVVNQRLPNVSPMPPAGYRPRQETVQLHQSIQQIIIVLAQRAMAQQAAQQQAAPAQPAPTGR